MIKIHDEESSQLWTGLKDFGKSGFFQWTDDSSVVFTNWNHGEPNRT